jgi:hypothetical protein
MKTIVLKFITINFFSVIIFVSCSKEEDINARNTAFLVKEPWKFERHGLDENNNGIIEESENGMLACEADDVFTFYATCTGVFSAGTTACSMGEPATINFEWRFLNHGTQLGIFAAAEMINRLDENILEVYYMDEDSTGNPVKYIRRFRH